MRSKNILLVEDDPFLIDIYTQKLSKASFNLDVANDGETALKMLKEKMPDLMLLDIVLPGMEGWQVLREIKKQTTKSKNLNKLKIIILSNLGQKSEVEKGLKLGAIKYLIKAHYTPREVVEEVKKILKS